MSGAYSVMLFFAACYILHRSVTMASFLTHESWPNKFLFVGLGVSLGFLSAGALGTVFSYWWGAPLLLIGITGFFLFDRREQNIQRTKRVANGKRTVG
jgi:hypothetical protein